MDPLSGAASVIAVVQISKEVLSLCGKYAKDAKDAKDDIDRLTNEIAALCDVLNRVNDLTNGPDAAKFPALRDLTMTISQCSSELTNLKTQLNLGKGRRVMKRLGLRALMWPFKTEDINKCSASLERCKTTINLALSADQSQLMIRVEGGIEQLQQDFADLKHQDLSKLHCVDGAAFNSRQWEHESQCLPDTRVDLLQQIITWSKDPSGACIFWLNGIAGAGKSTIARTVARTWSDQKQLGGSFFFSKGRGDLGHAAKFFTSLAAQLTNTLPSIRPYIYKVIEEIPDIFQRGLADQWKYLIFQPLSNYVKDVSLQSKVFILVVDALDECEGDDDTKLILRLLAELKTLDVIRLRVFITSRPETPIRFGFRTMPGAAHQDFVLHNISPSIIQHDISIFLQYKLENTRRENNIPEGWPGDDIIKNLCERASGLFIYASTACRLIEDPLFNPDQSLSLILQDDYVGQSSTRALDEMYTRILTYSISIFLKQYDKATQAKLISEFKLIIGSVVILFDALPAIMLDTLLNLPSRTVSMRIRCLHSVLDVPESDESPVRLLHPSFRDFLLDQQRCLDHQFRIDESQAHGDLLVSCLLLMSKHLKRDMCNLRLPGTLTNDVVTSEVQKCVPLDIQYACRYWVNHLRRSNFKLCDNDQVHTFLQTHFLHWLEALSLMRKMPDGVHMVKSLEAILIPRSDLNDLHMIAHDAKRFILNNRSIIETAPLQVYYSALVFSPRMSAIRQQFWDQTPRWIQHMPVVQEDWNPALQSLEGHSDWVNAVAFSPDAQLLASASDDNTVRLWGPSTGASRGTLEGHSSSVSAVAFSPDGQLLASASGDNTVRLWDPLTGASRGTLEGHSSSVSAVAFSPDGQLLASASFDNTVRLVDPSTGASRGTLESNSSEVCAVAFSPDGQLLASASRDNRVRLWDPSTGASRGTLEGHSSYVYAVAFSPDGQLLASASDDNTVRLWDPSTGASRGTLEGHSSDVCAVAFSPDGQLLASASGDNTVRLWDPSTGASRGTLEGHSAYVRAVAFSPDGQLLASASGDNTVRLWDPSTGASRGTHEGHSSGVYAVEFSPDGQLLASASASDDNTVRLWDPSTGASRGTLEGHSAYVRAVAFSPDGQLLASASGDNTVRLWDPSTGASRGTHEGHSSGVYAVEFSPDGQLLASASASDDNTVRLWDPSTGASRGTLEGHSSSVSAVAFSPDGQLLASASDDNTVRLWDPSTGASRGPLEGHSSRVDAVAFSPDGQLLTSASYDNTVRLWDPSTGASRGTLERHSSLVNAVAFSPDGQLLASPCWDNTVRLWDPSTGASRGTLEGHSSEVNAVAFSPDGQLLASASSDNTVRLWNVNTKATIQVRISAGWTRSSQAGSRLAGDDRAGLAPGWFDAIEPTCTEALAFQLDVLGGSLGGALGTALGAGEGALDTGRLETFELGWLAIKPDWLEMIELDCISAGWT
ncbi:NACHT and WD40 domain protein [Trichophaea hybrida]|nr:NACHT and WD40 domain protein [Trichophaea hybrida]